MPSIEVILPHGMNDDQQRWRAREWVTAHWVLSHDLPVTLAPCPTAEWSKGAAVNPVIEASTADVIVVADADSYVDSDAFTKAVDHATAHGWAMPHSVVKRISRQSTTEILSGLDTRPRLERGSYPALPGGGIILATKDCWSRVRGIDPRFHGWGGEDHALGLALTTLVGPVNARRQSALWHLWHPPHPQCRKPSQASRDLDARYRLARNQPAVMADLIGEW